MTPDLTITTYTYTVNEDSSITFTAGCDNVAQNLSGDLITGAIAGGDTAVTEYLDSYRDSYIQGLKDAQAQIGQGIQVGQPQSGS